MTVELGEPFEESGAFFEHPQLMPDERKLTREEVLGQFLTDDTGKRGRPISDRLLSFNGDGEYVKIAPGSSFIMPQIRDAYDVNHVRAIRNSIFNSAGGQLQNCGVALVSPDSLETYVDDLNRFFETDINPEDIPKHRKLGGHLITIFGHNRQLAIAMGNKEASGSPNIGRALFAKLFRDPAFWYVIEMQAAENNGLAPDSWVRSRAIAQYKELRERDGIPATLQEIGDKFGITSDNVWRAVRFEALPSKIKELVATKKLPYTGSFDFHQLEGIYTTEEIIELAQRLSSTKPSSDQLTQEIQKRVIVANLTPEIFILVEDGAITLTQAKQLNRMKQGGMSDHRINETATWICIKKPRINEVEKRVDGYLREIASGDLSMLEAYDETTPGASMTEELRRGMLTGLLTEGVSDVTSMLATLVPLFNSGIADDVLASNTPASNTIAAELGGTLRQIADGELVVTDSRFLDGLEKILEAEKRAGNGEPSPYQAVAQRILEYAQSNRSDQESLF